MIGSNMKMMKEKEIHNKEKLP